MSEGTNYRFARRVEGATGNVIREILKLTQQADVISFAGGLPSADAFPVEALQSLAADLLATDGPSILQYSTTEGCDPLRGFVADWVRPRGIETVPDNVLVLTGSQQGIDLACRVLLDPGDAVLVERPTYLAILQILKQFEARPVHVPGDADGMDPDALEDAIRRERPKMIYIVPTFRNPSGETWSAQRRRRLAELAARYNVVVVEDDPYGLLRYSGEPVPAVKAYDEGARVLYLGSFSKIVSPGLRVGFAVGPRDLLARMAIAKQGTDVHTTNLSQRLVESFGRSGDLDRHVESIRAKYGPKRDRMLAAIDRHFPSAAACTRPDGGLFLWATLPSGHTTTALLEEAVRRKVAFIPGVPFYADGGGDQQMRLNFSNASHEEIDTGIARLGELIVEVLAQR